MANHTVLIGNKYMAKDIDSLTRAVKAYENTDNGRVFTLGSKSTTGGEYQTWIPTVPTTASLADLWMAFEPELPFATAGTNIFNGLGTVQDFYTAASVVFTAIKPMRGDTFTMTAEGFASSTAPTAGQFAYATNGVSTLTAGTWPGTGVLVFKYSGSTTIPSADGSIGSGRITAYQLECVSNELVN
jgi:hypothetical protein